ncbi:hypothetical protein ACGFYV_11820 [Streptomyces sp. NPDC048297]|uniref:hypothetical protein n=1 Tax=Streptomyces sp. NPDC048297 TaxID=3365531 RepID=UPI00371F074F
MFYEPARTTWEVGADSPYRAPVLYAVGDMTRTVRARGDEVTVALWGPQDGAWHRFDTPDTTPAPPPAPAPDAPGKPSTSRAERMADRRQQVLMAGLGKAGLYDLATDDVRAMETMVDLLDEPTLRRVAHWLATAGGARGSLPPVQGGADGAGSS